MKYKISLNVKYTYDQPSSGGRQHIRIQPVEIPQIQHVYASNVTIDPHPEERSEFIDFFGNNCIDVSIKNPHKTLVLTLETEVERLEQPKLSIPEIDFKTLCADLNQTVLLSKESPHHFIGPSPRITSNQVVSEYVKGIVPQDADVLTTILSINEAIHKDMKFDANVTDAATPYEEAFNNRHGVCQDFSHIMIACLRNLGIPAGYVSGFLRTIPPEGQTRLEGADAMHAWVKAWLGQNVGWLEFDPTNNLMVSTDHIVIGYGRDYSDISPIRGVLRIEGNQASSQSVDVQPI